MRFSMRGLSVFVSLSVLCLLSPTVHGFTDAKGESGIEPAEYVPGQIIVRLTEHDAADTETIVRHGGNAWGAVSARRIFRNAEVRNSGHRDSWLLLEFPKDTDVPSRIQEIGNDFRIMKAEPNYIVRALTIPNDEYYASSGTWGQAFLDLWGHHKIGLTPLGSASGWDIESGTGAPVIVAVLDTGIDPSHEDLTGRLWINPGEIPGDGLDNDGNGYIDDVYGWNFVSGNNAPLDGHGHGTHCSGTIAAAANNLTGIPGISWGASIMALKGLSNSGSGALTDLVEGLVYAADNGADIISNSWGGLFQSDLLEEAVDYASEKGCLVIAAAGNSRASIDTYSFVPARYENVLSVAATDPDDKVALFSNYGTRVEVSAPGVDVLSLRASGTDMYGNGTHIVGERYYYASGTSMACPHVSGVAALLKALHPDWTARQIWDQIVHTADPIDFLNPGYAGLIGSGRLNARKALALEPQPYLTLESLHIGPMESVTPNRAADPGETAEIVVSIRNSWLSAQDVILTLLSNDPLVTVVQDTVLAGDIPGGVTVSNEDSPFVISVDSSAPFGHPAALILQATGAEGFAMEIPAILEVSRPRISIGSMRVADYGGNRDGIAGPGETVRLVMSLRNADRGAVAADLMGEIVSHDPLVTVLSGTILPPDLAPGTTWTVEGNYPEIEIDAVHSAIEPANLALQLTGNHGYSDLLEFSLAMPETRSMLWHDIAPAPFLLDFDPVKAEASPTGSIEAIWQSLIGGRFTMDAAGWRGGIWEVTSDVSRDLINVNDPSIGVDSFGRSHLGWLAPRSAPGPSPIRLSVTDIMYTVFDGFWTWPIGITENTDINALQYGAVCVDSLDRLHAVWQKVSYDVFSVQYYHAMNSGEGWSVPQAIYTLPGYSEALIGVRLEAGPGGQIVFCWLRGASTRIPYCMTFNGSSWSPPEVIPTDVPVEVYDFVLDAMGTLHYFYQPSEKVPTRRLYQAKMNGVWSSAFTVDSGINVSKGARMAIDRAGRKHFAWGRDQEIRYRVLENGVWTDPATAIAPHAGRQLMDFDVVADTQGRIHYLWRDVYFAEWDYKLWHAMRGRLGLPREEMTIEVR